MAYQWLSGSCSGFQGRLASAKINLLFTLTGVAPCPRHAQKGKVPPFGRTFPGLAIPRQELTTSSSLLTGLLALTVRVLLLLAGLVAAALLLTRFLARILILLTRVLVLAGHGNSLLNLVRFGRGQRQRRNLRVVSGEPGVWLVPP